MDPAAVLANGVDLALVSTHDGGRRAPLPGGFASGSRFTYRPNWGLPGWPGGEQTAGPVLGFSRSDIAPGEHTRAILVAVFVERVPAWHEVTPDDVLRMYEGPRVCGLGRVRWVEPATWQMPEEEQARLIEWLVEARGAANET